MNIKTLLLTTTAVIALSTAAFAADKQSYESNTNVKMDSKGNYTNNTKATENEADGTTNKSEENLTVEVDSKGNTNKSMTTKNTTDPKGLGNKHVVVTKETEDKEGGKTTSTYTKTIDGKTDHGTKDTYKNTSTVEKDAKGNYIEKDVTTKTDADGTTTKFEKNATVDVQPNGDTNKLTTTRKVTDPKGLFNKETVTTSNSEKEKDEMIKSTQEVIVDGKTVTKTTETVPQN